MTRGTTIAGRAHPALQKPQQSWADHTTTGWQLALATTQQPPTGPGTIPTDETKGVHLGEVGKGEGQEAGPK